MNVVCVRPTDDPLEALILVSEVKAEAVLGDPGVIEQMKLVKDFFSKKPKLDGIITGGLDCLEQRAFSEAKQHWLPYTITIKAMRGRKGGELSPVLIRVRLEEYVGFQSDFLGYRSFTIVSGGPTGFESVFLSRDFIENTSKKGWYACAGCHKYDTLFVPAEEMAKAHQELKSSVYQDQTERRSSVAG